jgi:hypothetical protein
MRIFFYLAHTFRFAEKKKKVFSKKKEVKWMNSTYSLAP